MGDFFNTPSDPFISTELFALDKVGIGMSVMEFKEAYPNAQSGDFQHGIDKPLEDYKPGYFRVSFESDRFWDGSWINIESDRFWDGSRINIDLRKVNGCVYYGRADWDTARRTVPKIYSLLVKQFGTESKKKVASTEVPVKPTSEKMPVYIWERGDVVYAFNHTSLGYKYKGRMSAYFLKVLKKERLNKNYIELSDPSERDKVLFDDVNVEIKESDGFISRAVNRKTTIRKLEAETKILDAFIAILPRSPIRSIKEYHHTYWSGVSSEEMWGKEGFELWIISSDSNSLVRIPDVGSGAMYGGVQLNESQLRMAGKLQDGDYLIAIYARGVRCSNIARLTIDSGFDAVAEPVLTLVPLPLNPGEKLPLLGIRAVGPTPQDPKLMNDTIAFPGLVVDGVERKLNQIKWVGPVGPLESGKIYTRIINLDGFEPAIEPGRKHTVKAIVGKYESAPVVIPADDGFGRQWEEAIELMPPTLPPKGVLEGVVTEFDGKAGAGFAVYLLAKSDSSGVTGKYRETSGKDGKYRFENIPSGEYEVVCCYGSEARPELKVKKVSIDANKPLKLDLSLQSHYYITGRVSYEDGKDAVKMDLTMVCGDTEGKLEFDNITWTDEKGRYKVGAPFGNVGYIGINGGRIEAEMPKLKPGTTELNYVLKKDKNGRYKAFPDVPVDGVSGVDGTEVKVSFGGEPSVAFMGYNGSYESGVETVIDLEYTDKLLKCKSIKFEQSLEGVVKGLMQLEVISYPKAKWGISVRLADGEGNEVKTVTEQFENSGVIAGISKRTEEVLSFNFGKVADIDKVKDFGIGIHEIGYYNKVPGALVEGGEGYGETREPLEQAGAKIRLDENGRIFRVYFSKATDEKMALLKGLKNLKQLDLETAKITEKGWVNLKGLRSLEKLSLYATSITDSGLVNLKDLTNLHELNLSRNSITDSGLVHLKVLTNLRMLDLSGNSITDAGLKHLKSLQNLEKLHINNNLDASSRMNITDSGMEHLKGLKKLRWLNLRSTRVGADGLNHLTQLPQLEEVILGGSAITDEAMAELAKIRGLKGLELMYTAVTDEGMKYLKEMENLEWFNLSSSNITDTGMAYIQECRKLTRLELRAANVGDESLIYIAKLPAMNRLDLIGSRYTAKGLATLKDIKKLRALWLYNLRLGQAEIDVLGELKNLERLVIPEHDLQVAGSDFREKVINTRRQLRKALPNTEITLGTGNLWFIPDDPQVNPKPPEATNSRSEEKPVMEAQDINDYRERVVDLFGLVIPDSVRDIKLQVVDADPLNDLKMTAYLRFDISVEDVGQFITPFATPRISLKQCYDLVKPKQGMPSWWTVEPSARINDPDTKKMAYFYQTSEGDTFIVPMPDGRERLYRKIYPMVRKEYQEKRIEEILGTGFPAKITNLKSNYFSSGTGDFILKARFDISEKDLIATIDKAEKISFKYADLKQDTSFVERICQSGPVKNKLKFWQEQKHKNIICTQERNGTSVSGRSIYIGVEKLDDVNVRVYFMHAGWRN